MFASLAALTAVSLGLNFTHYIADVERNYQFHTIAFVVPDSNFLQIPPMSVLQTPVILITDELHINHEHFINYNILFVAFVKDNKLVSSPNIFAHAKSMTRFAKVIVLNLDTQDSTDVDFGAIFRPFWKRKILKVIISIWNARGEMEAFTYNPFAGMAISKSEDARHPFDNSPVNTMGHPMRTFIFEDTPRSFKYINRQGKLTYGGCTPKLVLELIRKVNATLVEIDPDDYRPIAGVYLHELIAYEMIDVAMNSYALLTYILSPSYPIHIYKSCILVPAAPELRPALYNILPFDNAVWYSLLGFVLYFSFVDFIFKSMYIRNLEYLNVIIDGIGIIIGNIERIEIYKRSWQGSAVFMCLAAFGIIVTNLYQSTLTSLYTTKVYEKELETVEDIMRANLTILASQFEWSYERNLVQPAEFTKQFVPMPMEQFTGLRRSLNNSYGYICPSDKVDALLAQQSDLKHPLFRSLIACHTSAALMIPLPYYSPFEEALNRVIFQCQQGGLINKWQKDTQYEITEAGLTHRTVVPGPEYNALIVDHFLYFWIFWFVGNLFATVTFVLEMIVYSFNKQV